jgi:hypothetical protein
MINYKIDTFDIGDLIDNDKIIIPNFQRGLVWKSEKKKRFINTVLEGDPFGVILVFRSSDVEGVEKYELIDGLQRISTLREFKKNPFKFLEPDFLDNEIIVDIDSLLLGEAQHPIIDQRVRLLKKSLLLSYSMNTKPSDLFEFLNQKYTIKQHHFLTLMRYLEQLDGNIKDKLKLTNLQVPAIIYIGDRKKLPVVFERLNTGAVNLSKYEVLAASWSARLIKIEDNDLSEKVITKYKNLESISEMDVKFDEEDLKKRLNVFEYCYALGELLLDVNKGAPSIFGKKKDVFETESIGFELIALLSGNEITDVSKIDALISDNDGEFIVKLKDSILEVARQLEQKVGIWFVMPKARQPLNVLTGYQSLHLFCSYYFSAYSINFKTKIINKKNNKRWLTSFDKYGKFKLLYDCITNYWSLNRQVSDLTLNIKEQELLNRYNYPVKTEDWHVALSTWMVSQLSNARKNISSENRLFLLFIHKMNLELDNTYFKKMNSSSLDVEHIIPQRKLKKTENLSISCVSNLCLLPEYDNRSKKDITLYEDEERRSALDINEWFLDKIIYPKKEELEFFKYTSKDFAIGYTKFTKDRCNTLTNTFVNLMGEYCKK